MAAMTRVANMNGGVPRPGTPMVFPFRSLTVRMSPFAAACTRKHPRWMPPVNFTSSPCSIGLRKYITRWCVTSKRPSASASL